MRIKLNEPQGAAKDRILAATNALTYYATRGYLTTSTISIEAGFYEVTVHINGMPYPNVPDWLKVTECELTEFESTRERGSIIKTIDLFFY